MLMTVSGQVLKQEPQATQADSSVIIKTEIPEYFSERMFEEDVKGCFLQAESEVSAINMVYGAARLHHLRDDAVGTDHSGGAVLVSQIKGLAHAVDGLLHGAGREHDQVVIAVTAALGHRLRYGGADRQVRH